jgi:hypothetical protein
VAGQHELSEECQVEVRIGVQHVPREIALESAQTPEQVEKLVTEALAGSALRLVDEKGRRVIVPADKLAYVEIAEQSHRPVGFTPG